HAVVAIGHATQRGGIVGADEVALHQVPGGAIVREVNAIVRIAGDDVAGPGRRAADGVVGRAGVKDHAVVAVGHGGEGGGVTGANEITLHQVPGCAGAAEVNAIALVA